MRARATAGALVVAALLTGCAIGTTTAPTSSGRAEAPPRSPATAPAKTAVDPAHVERLKKAMLPLLQVMDKPLSPGQLMNTAGPDGGGGFLSTHPATGDRIQELRRL